MMKNLIASVGIAMMIASPMALAQNSSEAQMPEQGGATNADTNAYRTQTLVGAGVGVVSAGALIALAADDGDDENISLGSGTTGSTGSTGSN